MSVFQYIQGKYLPLFLIAVTLHTLLASFSPDPNGYVWDFYSEAIQYTYEHGELPAADACWVCYHPPLLPILGSAVFHLAGILSIPPDSALYGLAGILNICSLLFSVYSFAIYKQYQTDTRLDLILWGFILFLPVVFIASFAVESDLLVATFIVMSLYYFLDFLDRQTILSLCLASVLVALAALTKYSGLVFVFIYVLVLGIRCIKEFNRAVLKQLLVYCGIVIAIGGYPYLKNTIETGTPIVGNKAWNGKGYYTYNFTDFSIPRIIEVFSDTRPIKLKHYYQFNSEVLNSIYGQLWTDFSFFTIPYRHGQHELKFIYQGKYMPDFVLWAILISGLIPTCLGITGFLSMLFQPDKYLLIFITFVSLAVYVHWFMGHNYWMLKSKYLLFLIPVWIISIDQTRRLINPVILQLLLLPSVVFSLVYCFFFAVY